MLREVGRGTIINVGFKRGLHSKHRTITITILNNMDKTHLGEGIDQPCNIYNKQKSREMATPSV
jgi:hypothetical protein